MIELQEVEVKVSNIEVVRKALKAIKSKSKDKVLVAEDVVEDASHPDHILHKDFEWDDTVAGHQWRLTQARALIRKVFVSDPEDDGQTYPGWVSLRSDRKSPRGGYRETNDVINNKQFLSELEETAKRDIEAVLARYQMLKDLCAKVRKAAGIKGKSKGRK